jgi:hypothetical protein
MGFRCTAYAEFEDFAKQHNGGGGWEKDLWIGADFLFYSSC